MDYAKFLKLENLNIQGWLMVQDAYMLPDVPQNLFKQRPNIPVIIGNCRDEGSLADLVMLASGLFDINMYGKSFFEMIFAGAAGYLTTREADVLSMLEASYSPPGTADDDHVAWLSIMNNIMTSAAFTRYTGKEIDWYLQQGNTQMYVYELEYATMVGRPKEVVPNWRPVFHCSDIYLLFMVDYYWEPLLANGTLSPKEFEMADFLGETWTNFARFGMPRLDGSWKPTRTIGGQEYFAITADKHAMKEGWRRVDRVLWNRAIDSLIGDWPPAIPDYNNGTWQSVDQYTTVKKHRRRGLLNNLREETLKFAGKM